jgi:hypothetical protein
MENSSKVDSSNLAFCLNINLPTSACFLLGNTPLKQKLRASSVAIFSFSPTFLLQFRLFCRKFKGFCEKFERKERKMWRSISEIPALLLFLSFACLAHCGLLDRAQDALDAKDYDLQKGFIRLEASAIRLENPGAIDKSNSWCSLFTKTCNTRCSMFIDT